MGSRTDIAREGARDEGRVSSACGVGKRGVNWRNPAYATTGTGCNAASILRDRSERRPPEFAGPNARSIAEIDRDIASHKDAIRDLTAERAAAKKMRGDELRASVRKDWEAGVHLSIILASHPGLTAGQLAGWAHRGDWTRPGATQGGAIAAAPSSIAGVPT